MMLIILYYGYGLRFMLIHVNVSKKNPYDSQAQGLLSVLSLQFVTGGTTHGL